MSGFYLSFKKFLSCLLTIALVVGMLLDTPITFSYAEDITTLDTVAISDEEISPIVVLGEVIEKRERFTKHFRMSDGTQVAAVYPQAVHYEKDGQWLDVNNRLEEGVSGKGTVVLQTAHNRYRASFAKYQSSEELVNIKIDDKEISWALESSLDSEIMDITQRLENEDNRILAADDAYGFYARNINSSVRYKEVLPGVDLDYILKAEQIKEKLILNCRETTNTFTFIYNFDGLKPYWEFFIFPEGYTW